MLAAVDLLDDVCQFWPIIDLLESLFEKYFGKSELILEQMLHELIVSTVEVVKDPSVEEFKSLYLFYRPLIHELNFE